MLSEEFINISTEQTWILSTQEGTLNGRQSVKWEDEGAKDNADATTGTTLRGMRGLVWSAGLVMRMANPCLDNIFNLTKKIDSPLFNISGLLT